MDIKAEGQNSTEPLQEVGITLIWLSTLWIRVGRVSVGENTTKIDRDLQQAMDPLWPPVSFLLNEVNGTYFTHLSCVKDYKERSHGTMHWRILPNSSTPSTEVPEPLLWPGLVWNMMVDEQCQALWWIQKLKEQITPSALETQEVSTRAGHVSWIWRNKFEFVKETGTSGGRNSICHGYRFVNGVDVSSGSVSWGSWDVGGVDKAVLHGNALLKASKKFKIQSFAMAFPSPTEAPSAGHTLYLQGWVGQRESTFLTLNKVVHGLDKAWKRKTCGKGRWVLRGVGRKFPWIAKWMLARSSSVLLGVNFRTLLPIPKLSSLPRLFALAPVLNFLPSQTTSNHSFLPAMVCPSATTSRQASQIPPPGLIAAFRSVPLLPPGGLHLNMSPVCRWHAHPCVSIICVSHICSAHQFHGYTFRSQTPLFSPLRCHLAGITNSVPQRTISDSLRKELNLWMSCHRIGAKSQEELSLEVGGGWRHSAIPSTPTIASLLQIFP